MNDTADEQTDREQEASGQEYCRTQRPYFRRRQGNTTMKSSSFHTDSGDGFTELLVEIINAVPGCRCEVKVDPSGIDERSVIVTQFYEDNAALDRMCDALESDRRFMAHWEAYEESNPLKIRRTPESIRLAGLRDKVIHPRLQWCIRTGQRGRIFQKRRAGLQ